MTHRKKKMINIFMASELSENDCSKKTTMLCTPKNHLSVISQLQNILKK